MAVSDLQTGLSGATVQASGPIQVLAGSPCRHVPDGVEYCGHLEETVLPSEALGRQYVIALPPGPHSLQPVSQLVAFFGLSDGTNLTYPAGAPAGAPLSINGHQVATLEVSTDLLVTGTAPFSVATFTLGATKVDLSPTLDDQNPLYLGNPSETIAIPIEQYRTSYRFPTQPGVTVRYLEVVGPQGTALELDGAPAQGTTTSLGRFSVTRIALSLTSNEHELVASQPVGAQVISYGPFSTWAYPAGLSVMPSP